jgi:hypothetical protein
MTTGYKQKKSIRVIGQQARKKNNRLETKKKSAKHKKSARIKKKKNRLQTGTEEKKPKNIAYGLLGGAPVDCGRASEQAEPGVGY